MPAVIASRNLFGIVNRWLYESGGSVHSATSAEATHDASSSGWTAGSVKCRPANRGSASRATLRSHPRPNPSSTNAVSGTSSTASAASSVPTYGPSRPQNRQIRVDGGSPVAARIRSGATAGAVHGSG